MGDVKPNAHSPISGPWSAKACALAIWAYDRLDLDRSLKEEQVCHEIAGKLGRHPTDVRTLIRSVAACDLRPPSMKPVLEDQEVRGKLRLYFSEYWQDRESARARIQEQWFGTAASTSQGEEARKVLRTLALGTPPPSPSPAKESIRFDPKAWGQWQSLRSGSPGGTPAVGGPLLQSQKRIGALRALPLQFRAAWVAQPFPEEALRPLADAIREVIQRTSRLRMPPPPDPQAFQKAREKWKSAKAGSVPLDRRDIRCLCQQVETALSPAWVLYLVHAESIKLRRIWVESLLAHYLAHWRTMESPDALESALRHLLRRLPEGETWATELIQEAFNLIGPEVPQRLVKALPHPLRGLEGLLQRWALSREVGLGHAVLLEVLRSWEQSYRAPQIHRPVGEVAADLREGFQGILLEPGIPEETFCSIVSTLVLAEWVRAHAELRDCLLEEILAHPRLGDPRLKKHHWYSMPMARDRVISWMARKDLRLFYDSVVSDYADDQGRKAFWLNYVDQVSDFRLVLAEDDRYRLEEALGEGKFQFASMEGNGKVSAFILRFRTGQSADDLVCVEFSRTGNSLYAYDASSFEAGVGRLDAHSFRIGSEPRNLKNREYCKATQRHAGYWQGDVAQYLKLHGIVPS